MLKAFFLILFITAALADSIGFWRGQIYLYHTQDLVTEKKNYNLEDAKELCSKMGSGHLPSIHSKYDIIDLRKIVGSSELWLGAKTQDHFGWSGNQLQIHSFAWKDGTVFDFKNFNEHVCTSDCCGVMLPEVDEVLQDSSCFSSVDKVFCVFPYTTEELLKFYDDADPKQCNIKFNLVEKNKQAREFYDKYDDRLDSLNETLHELQRKVESRN